jgi:hypothetical protein
MCPLHTHQSTQAHRDLNLPKQKSKVRCQSSLGCPQMPVLDLDLWGQPCLTLVEHTAPGLTSALDLA